MAICHEISNPESIDGKDANNIVTYNDTQGVYMETQLPGCLHEDTTPRVPTWKHNSTLHNTNSNLCQRLNRWSSGNSLATHFR